MLHAISFFYATYLTFPQHVADLKTAASVRHAVSHKKKPIPSLTSHLMRAMILLDDVVKILALPQFASAWHHSRRFQFLECFG
jgi:hypothetical protein